MKNLILNNWGAKLVSLMIATTLWFLVKKNIEPMSRSYNPTSAQPHARSIR